MSKALKSNNKLLVNGGKLVTHNSTIFGEGCGSKRTYFMHNGKIITTTIGLPFFARGLSPVMHENTWAEIGDAIKHYRELGLPWELGSYKDIVYEDENGDEQSMRAVLAGDNDIIENGIAVGHVYNFITDFRVPFQTYADYASNRSFCGYLEVVEDDQTGMPVGYIYHENEHIQKLKDVALSMAQKNTFYPASLEELHNDNDMYYDTSLRLRHKYNILDVPNALAVERTATTGLFLTCPSIADLTRISTDYPPNDYYFDYEEPYVTLQIIGKQYQDVTKIQQGAAVDLRYIKNVFDIQDDTERSDALYDVLNNIYGDYIQVYTKSFGNGLTYGGSGSIDYLYTNIIGIDYNGGHAISGLTNYIQLPTIFSLKALY